MANPHIDSVPLEFERRAPEESATRAEDFYRLLDRRRSVREFSPDPVPREWIEHAIMTASTAPSGAHRQPWRFVAVSDKAIQREIRLAAEEEERKNYSGRMPPDWIEALAPLGTDDEKPYLEIVPWLVVCFEEGHSYDAAGEKQKNYYVKESVGIACGMFISAIHNLGLATLTHTPSPMGFLAKILNRPANERPFLLFPVGYPAEGTRVPNLSRKPLEDVAVFHEPSE